MASNVKWFKRAYRVLNAGHTEIWELIKHKLPEERRNFLENKFLKKEINSTTEVAADAMPETTPPPADEPALTTAAPTKKATTKKVTPRRTNKSKAKKVKPAAVRNTRTTSKEK